MIFMLFQGAATRALDKGITLNKVIEMVRKVSPSIKAPLVMFTYFNPIMRKGMDNFCSEIKSAGASGEPTDMVGVSLACGHDCTDLESNASASVLVGTSQAVRTLAYQTFAS